MAVPIHDPRIPFSNVMSSVHGEQKIMVALNTENYQKLLKNNQKVSSVFSI